MGNYEQISTDDGPFRLLVSHESKRSGGPATVSSGNPPHASNATVTNTLPQTDRAGLSGHGEGANSRQASNTIVLDSASSRITEHALILK